jgi:hypothetical protein
VKGHNQLYFLQLSHRDPLGAINETRRALSFGEHPAGKYIVSGIPRTKRTIETPNLVLDHDPLDRTPLRGHNLHGACRQDGDSARLDHLGKNVLCDQKCVFPFDIKQLVRFFHKQGRRHSQPIHADVARWEISAGKPCDYGKNQLTHPQILAGIRLKKLTASPSRRNYSAVCWPVFTSRSVSATAASFFA